MARDSTDQDDSWIAKYARQSMDELVVAKKKVGEFVEAASNAQILILTGPTGCCKNTLLKTYCRQKGCQLLYFKDERTEHLDDLYGKHEFIPGTSKPYPDDLENLLFFIKQNCS